MECDMIKKTYDRKILLWLKVLAVFLFIAAVFGLLFIANEIHTSHKQYLESQKNIYWCIANQLNKKNPNELTESDFEKVEELQILLDGITTTEPLLKLKNLKCIDFKYGPNPKLNININYEPLAKLQKLQEIRVSVMEDNDAVLIRDKLYEKVFPFLKILRRGTTPFDLDRLRNLKQIESLSLSYPEMKNYKALTNLPNLRHLGIGRTGISNPAFLKELSNLKTLFLSNVRIPDITAISGLENLESLTILYSDIKDLSPLAKLKNLKSLTLYSPKLESIDALASLTNLETLDLSITNIISLYGSVSHPKLQDLKMSPTQVSDIKSLAKLTNLRVLNLRGLRKITDITPLKQLINLKEINLENCENISDEQIEDL
jgi:internalin A